MAKADLSEYKRKYEIFRHHAWAGTAFLSILLALRYFIASIPRYIFIPVGILLIVYILIALVYTYRYGAGLSGTRDRGRSAELSEMENAQTPGPEGLKIEKKRAKTEAKVRKKEQKAIKKASEQDKKGS
jgi:hypothetical protein